MVLEDINPFIRYAAKTILNQKKGLYKAKDHHLFYINEGNEQIRIDGVLYPLKEQNLLLIPAGTDYEFLLNNPIIFTSINFDFSQIRRNFSAPFHPVPSYYTFTENDIIKNENFQDTDLLNRTVFLENGSFARHTLEQIIVNHHFSDQYSSSKNSSLLKGLLIDTVKISLAYSDYDSRVDEVYRYIEQNYKLDFSNGDIARSLGLHPYYLNKIFRQKTGTTIHQYLLNYRIKIAEQLLISTNDPIYQISENVGFHSTALFVKNFKIKKGMTPAKYRTLQKSLI